MKDYWLEIFQTSISVLFLIYLFKKGKEYPK